MRSEARLQSFQRLRDRASDRGAKSGGHPTRFFHRFRGCAPRRLKRPSVRFLRRPQRKEGAPLRATRAFCRLRCRRESRPSSDIRVAINAQVDNESPYDAHRNLPQKAVYGAVPCTTLRLVRSDEVRVHFPTSPSAHGVHVGSIAAQQFRKLGARCCCCCERSEGTRARSCPG